MIFCFQSHMIVIKGFATNDKYVFKKFSDSKDTKLLFMISCAMQTLVCTFFENYLYR